MTQIKLFEAFAGVGSQFMALKNIGVDVESVGISEWDINAILSYDAIHSKNRYVDLTVDMTSTDLDSFLLDAGISANGKDLMTKESIKKITESRKREIVNAMKRTNNIGSIVGKTAPKCDLFTYSFPCQDISIAGKQGGFSYGSDTRSSLLWECRNTVESVKPKVLLMENVKNLVSKKYKDDFDVWCNWLMELGYKNYWKVLNAKDFGSAQSRERVFMVSILNEGLKEFEFPKGRDEIVVLKDILENIVDSEYYIEGGLTLKNTLKKENKPSIITHKYIEKVKVRVYEVDRVGLANMLREYKSKSKKTIKELAVELRTPSSEVEHWFRLDKSFSIPKACIWFELKKSLGIYSELYDDAIMKFTIKDSNFDQANRVYDEKGLCPTLTASVTSKKILIEDNVTNEKYIRKLTPKECWRLMGFSDQDFRKASNIMSDNQLYKQAGNSIVISVLEDIFKTLYL